MEIAARVLPLIGRKTLDRPAEKPLPATFLGEEGF
jgi:hypothetical protein